MIPFWIFTACLPILSTCYAYSLHTRDDISALQSKLSKGAFIAVPGEAEFDTLTTRYTDYQRPTFSIAVHVATHQDVVESVAYAEAHNITFMAQSGGHGLTTSTQVIQNGLQINMRGLNYSHFDLKKNTVTIGGGLTTGELTNRTYEAKREITVGSCPCTGIMGIGLGAGIGRLQGKYGYLIDNLLSLELLLANGTIITVNEETNPDLFWAVRGAGHNFGIGIEATYRIHPQLNDGNHYVVDMEWPINRTAEVFEVMNKVVDMEMPKELAFFVTGQFPGASGVPAISIDFVWSGPPADAQDALKLWTDINPIYKSERVVTWAALPWTTYGGLNNDLCGNPGGQRNFYAANTKRYDIPTMQALAESWESMSIKYNGTASFLLMFESFPQQGPRAVDPDSTAFPWRWGAQHFLMLQATYNDLSLATELDDWLKYWQEQMIATSGYGRLQQYINYGHGFYDPVEALYGYDSWRLEKLRKLKAQYDPTGRFNGYQPVGVRPGATDVCFPVTPGLSDDGNNFTHTISTYNRYMYM